MTTIYFFLLLLATAAAALFAAAIGAPILVAIALYESVRNFLNKRKERK